jgi:formiminoglutamase
VNAPHCTPGKWPAEIAVSRLAAHIEREHADGCCVAILGLPDDTGVRLNNGRPGAREGPAAFRSALARYGVAHPYAWEWPKVFDAGDVQPAHGSDEQSLLETHTRVEAATMALLEAGLFPFAVGGGHDLTLPFVRAVVAHARTNGARTFEGVYFDAHLDVRETIGSGMAFRRVLEDLGVRPLTLNGFNPMVNAREHAEWFLAQGGVIAPDDTPRRANAPAGPCFVSFDLDVLGAGDAPGVSAPRPDGWTTARGAAWMEHLGSCAHVRCADIMELNPGFDQDGRTARIAAHLFLSFLKGYARRGSTP